MTPARAAGLVRSTGEVRFESSKHIFVSEHQCVSLT